MIGFNLSYIEGLISLDESTLLNIIIEPIKGFRCFIKDLSNHINTGLGDNRIYINGKEKDFGKLTFLIANPLFLDLDDKKINSFIQKDVITSVSDEQKLSFDLLIKDINEWLNNVTLNSDIPIEYNHDVSISDFLKVFSISKKNFDDDEVESFVYNLKSISFVFGIKVFFILNMHDYYFEEEIRKIFYELLKHDIHIVLISNKEPKKYADFERAIVIDNDLAEIHKFFK